MIFGDFGEANHYVPKDGAKALCDKAPGSIITIGGLMHDDIKKVKCKICLMEYGKGKELEF